MDTIEYIQKLIDRKPLPEHFQKIVSALRGPDMVMCDHDGYLPNGGLGRLKYLTTGRIRGIVAPGYNGAVTCQKLTEAERVERDHFLRYAPQHFRSHYNEAVEAIKAVYGYDLKHEVDYATGPKTVLVDNGGSLRKLFGTYTPLPLPTSARDDLGET